MLRLHMHENVFLLSKHLLISLSWCFFLQMNFLSWFWRLQNHMAPLSYDFWWEVWSRFNSWVFCVTHSSPHPLCFLRVFLPSVLISVFLPLGGFICTHCAGCLLNASVWKLMFFNSVLFSYGVWWFSSIWIIFSLILQHLFLACGCLNMVLIFLSFFSCLPSLNYCFVFWEIL